MGSVELLESNISSYILKCQYLAANKNLNFGGENVSAKILANQVRS